MLKNKINKPPHTQNAPYSNEPLSLDSSNKHNLTLPELKSILKQNPSFISNATLPLLLTSLFHRNDHQMLSYILSLPSQSNEHDTVYREFLFKCCEHAKKDLIRPVLELRSGVDLNFQNSHGDTPLHILCSKGAVECVKEVMKHHPSTHVKNNNGLTPYDCAFENGNKEVMSILKCEGGNSSRFCFNERDNLEKSVDCQGYAVIVNKKQSDNVHNNKVQEILVEESDFTVSGVVDNNEGENSVDDSNDADNDSDTDNDDRVKIIQSGNNINSYSCGKKNVSLSMNFPKGNKCVLDSDKTADKHMHTVYDEQQQQHQHQQLPSPLKNRTSPNMNGIFTFDSQNKEELINELQQNDNFNFSPSNKYPSIKSIQHSSTKREEPNPISTNANKDIISNTYSFSKPPHNVKVSDSLAKINKLPSSLIYTPSKQKSKPKINSNSYTSSTTAAIHNKRFNTSSDIFTSSDINVCLTTNANNNLINSSRGQKPKQPVSHIISSSLADNSTSLYSFLKEIELQAYTDILCANGFDDVSLMIEQTKSDMAMTEKNLKDIGVNLIGDRAKILIRLEEKAMLFPFTLEKEKVYYHSTRNRNTLFRMLSTIKLESFTDCFINAGYPSADLLIIQMLSRQPLNESQLEQEVGIEKIGYRMRIIHKLKSEAAVYGARIKKSAVIFETRKQENEEFCNLCNVF